MVDLYMAMLGIILQTVQAKFLYLLQYSQYYLLQYSQCYLLSVMQVASKDSIQIC